MDIRWLADRTFAVNAASGILVTDPFPGSSPGPEHDSGSTVATISHAGARDGIDAWRSGAHIIDSPGEYEISGLGVRGIATAIGDANDPAAINVVYVLDAELLTVCYLGAIAGPLTTQAAQLVGRVDVLITPAGGSDQTLSADQAAAVARALEPKVIIPAHPGVPAGSTDLSPLDPFITEIGLPRPEAAPRFNVTRTNIGETQRLVLLRPVGAQ